MNVRQRSDLKLNICNGVSIAERLGIEFNTFFSHLSKTLFGLNLVKSKVLLVGRLPLSEHSIVVDTVEDSPKETECGTPEDSPVETAHDLREWEEEESNELAAFSVKHGDKIKI